MRGLLETPDDIKLKILEASGPQDIRACQLVCRALYNLIVSSPQIQYILALDALGYAMPSVPRQDITPRQKVEFLQRHRQNWSSPATPQLTEYALPLHEAGSHKFNGGVYACALFRDEVIPVTDKRIVGIHFYRLPSLNLGLEFRDWCIPDFGLAARGFAFDTSQDLLVLVELTNPGRDWSEGCRIHLRTMSDNSQHPRAAAPVLLAEFTHSLAELGDEMFTLTPFDIKVVANSLAILFRSHVQVLTSWLIVWDWNRGEELTRISTGGRHGANSFTLLCHNKFLLPRHSKSHYLQDDVLDDTCGSLDVYIFDPDVTTSTPAHMIASFELPKFDAKSCQSMLLINGRQLPDPPSTWEDTRPKVYDPTGKDRLIAVAVWFRSFPNAWEVHHQEFLYIPSSVLAGSQMLSLNTDISDGSDAITSVPWDSWAPLIFRRKGDRVVPRGNYLYVQRAAIISRGGTWQQPSNETPTRVILVDFNRRGARLAIPSKENTAILPEVAMPVDLSRGGKGPSSQERTRERGWGILQDSLPPRHNSQDRFETRAHPWEAFREARTEYVVQEWSLPRGPGDTIYHDVAMDDEHGE